MGGSLVFDLAHEDDRLDAAVAFYGMTDFEGRTPAAPLQAHYGTEDDWSAEQLEAVGAHLEAHGGEVHVYPGANHAFFNDAREDHDPECRRARLGPRDRLLRHGPRGLAGSVQRPYWPSSVPVAMRPRRRSRPRTSS